MFCIILIKIEVIYISIKPNQYIDFNNKKVLAEDLSKNSSKKAVCICDICGKEVLKTMKQYYSSLEKHNGLYICKECFNNNKEILEYRKNKMKQTCLEKYGTENPMQNEDVKNKIKNTFLNKYGVEYAGQIQEAIEKRKNTCIDKYGVSNPATLSDNSKCHSKEAREKAINTMRERYGGVGFEIEEIKEKAKKSLANSGKVLTSSQQKKIYNTLLKLYPKATECVMNKPLNNLFLDISLKIDEILIDIEVDGFYWHKDYQKDRKRDEVVKKEGYKVLRIKFDHSIPTENQLIDSINKLLNTNHNYYELVLDKCKT